jgi:hypothetical protein
MSLAVGGATMSLVVGETILVLKKALYRLWMFSCPCIEFSIGHFEHVNYGYFARILEHAKDILVAINDLRIDTDPL